MSSHRLLVPALIALALVALTGCTPVATSPSAEPPAASAPSVTPTPTASAGEAAATVPACDDLAGADLLATLAAAGFTLDEDWAESGAENFGNLRPFADYGGLVCIWGSPAHPEQPTALAWSPLGSDSRDALVASLAAEGATTEEALGGVLYSAQNAFDDGVYGYLVRENEGFYSTEVGYLEGVAGRVDAITGR